MDDVIGKHLVMLAVVRMDCTLDNVEANLASIATTRARRQARAQSHRHLLMAQQSCDDDFGSCRIHSSFSMIRIPCPICGTTSSAVERGMQ